MRGGCLLFSNAAIIFDKIVAMKTIFSLLLLFSINLNAQELVDNKVDEFTKYHLKRTSWEMAFATWGGKYSYYRFTNIDSTIALDLRISLNNTVFSMREKEKIMMKLDNDSILTLYNLTYAITKRGGAAKGITGSANMGLQATFILNNDAINALMKNRVVKIRIYTTDGYAEEEVNKDRSATFQSALSLVI